MTSLHRAPIFLILFCISLPVFGQKTENELISRGGERMLVLNNGTYYYGKLVRIFKEGVLFDPEVELDFDNPPPTFFPFASVLHIRDMDGSIHSNQQLERLADISIRDYNLPDEIEYYKWKNIANPYFINLEFGWSRNPVDGLSLPTYQGNYAFNVDYSTLDLSLDLSYRLSTWFDMGCRLDFKRYNIQSKGLDTAQPEQPTNYINNFGLDHIRIFSPFCPIFKISRGGHKWRANTGVIFGPAFINELPGNSDGSYKANGLFFGGIVALDYRLTERTSLGAEYNYYHYHFTNERLKKTLFNYKHMVIHSFKVSFKYYMNW